jgi:hypothetical protein
VEILIKVIFIFVSSTSMEMSLFIISDLQLFVRRRDLLPGVNGGAVRLQFFRCGLQDLASPDRF